MTQSDQPALPLTPPIRCKKCDDQGTVYFLYCPPGRVVWGGKRIPCPECNGTKWVGEAGDG